MKDLHTHILYDIDDGAKSLEESLKILMNASLNGVSDVVLTPHYINGTKYNADNLRKKKLFSELKKWVEVSGVNINLYLGNEVYIYEDILNDLDKEILTINNSRYILIEFALNTKYSFIEEVLYKIKDKGLVPIIAHPERYVCYYKDYDFFNKLISMGCLLQGNIGSIYGDYGRMSKVMIMYMLRNDMIHFLASDIHSGNDKIYSKNIERDLFKIVKDKKKVDRLLNINIEMVLRDIRYSEWSN